MSIQYGSDRVLRQTAVNGSPMLGLSRLYEATAQQVSEVERHIQNSTLPGDLHELTGQ